MAWSTDWTEDSAAIASKWHEPASPRQRRGSRVSGRARSRGTGPPSQRLRRHPGGDTRHTLAPRRRLLRGHLTATTEPVPAHRKRMVSRRLRPGSRRRPWPRPMRRPSEHPSPYQCPGSISGIMRASDHIEERLRVHRRPRLHHVPVPRPRPGTVHRHQVDRGRGEHGVLQQELAGQRENREMVRSVCDARSH